MGMLLDAFEAARFRPGYVDVTTIIGQYIKEALKPWDAGNATVYVGDQYRSDTNRFMTIVIQIELLPDMPFEYGVRPDIHSDDEYAHEIGQKAFEFYRNRPTLPVDDHIILGSE